MHSNRGPMTKEDIRVHHCPKVHSWKACAKPMEVVPRKLKYTQKKDNRESTIEGVYTRVCFVLFGLVFVTLLPQSLTSLTLPCPSNLNDSVCILFGLNFISFYFQRSGR